MFHNETKLLREYQREDGLYYWSLTHDLKYTFGKKTFIVPKNTFLTPHKNKHDILYHYLMSERTISPIYASMIYYKAMKDNKVGFKERVKKFLKSLLYLI